MILTKKIEQYDNKNVFFCEPIKNNVMNEGVFTRIIYSTQYMSLNGIYLSFLLKDITCEKFYNKYKCFFNITNNKEIVDNLKIVEEEILKKYKTNKLPSYKIYEQIKAGYIKTFSGIGNNQQFTIILKISGIWETESNYGLTYKFILQP
jgi:hypothetical protein